MYESFNTEIFPPKEWQTPASAYSWQSIVVDSGINCLPDTVAYVNHYWINHPGIEAYLISNKIKLGGGQTAENWLIYDYAYSGYAAGYDDGLRIDISTDCGNTWDSIYGAIGPDLQTTAYVNAPWYPTCGSWDTDSINLSNWGLNGDTIMIRFAAINDYGNRFFMDNVTINGLNILNTSNTKHINTSIYPNPSKGKFTIRTNVDKMNIEVYTLLGSCLFKENIIGRTKTLDLSKQRKGVYFIKLQHNNTTELKKLIVE